MCGTWRGGRGALQGPALPRARTAGGQSRANTPSTPHPGCAGFFLGERATRIPDLILPQGKPHFCPSEHCRHRGVCGMRSSAMVGSLGSVLCLSFPSCESAGAMLCHPCTALTEPCLQRRTGYCSSHPSFPCQGKLQCLLSSWIKSLQPEGRGLSSQTPLRMFLFAGSSPCSSMTGIRKEAETSPAKPSQLLGQGRL